MGRYYCKVVLDESVFEREIYLKVIKNEKEKTLETFVVEKAGDNITLDCLDMEGRTQPSSEDAAVWRKNGEKIVGNGSQLKLIRVDKEDTGIYHCLVSGGLTRNVSIQVKHPPIIEVYQPIVKQHPGYAASLSCVVTSVPVPVIRWYKLGGSHSHLMPETPLLASEVTTEVESGYPAPVLANSNHLSINVELKDGEVTSRIYFWSILATDYGVYSCNATNSLGTVSSKLRLMYSKVPVITPVADLDSAATTSVHNHLLVLLIVYLCLTMYSQTTKL